MRTSVAAAATRLDPSGTLLPEPQRHSMAADNFSPQNYERARFIPSEYWGGALEHLLAIAHTLATPILQFRSDVDQCSIILPTSIDPVLAGVDKTNPRRARPRTIPTVHLRPSAEALQALRGINAATSHPPLLLAHDGVNHFWALRQPPPLETPGPPLTCHPLLQSTLDLLRAARPLRPSRPTQTRAHDIPYTPQHPSTPPWRQSGLRPRTPPHRPPPADLRTLFHKQLFASTSEYRRRIALNPNARFRHHGLHPVPAAPEQNPLITLQLLSALFDCPECGCRIPGLSHNAPSLAHHLWCRPLSP